MEPCSARNDTALFSWSWHWCLNWGCARGNQYLNRKTSSWADVAEIGWRESLILFGGSSKELIITLISWIFCTRVATILIMLQSELWYFQVFRQSERLKTTAEARPLVHIQRFPQNSEKYHKIRHLSCQIGDLQRHRQLSISRSINYSFSPSFTNR